MRSQCMFHMRLVIFLLTCQRIEVKRSSNGHGDNEVGGGDERVGGGVGVVTASEVTVVR